MRQFEYSLPKVESKVLIMHAEDDLIIPIYQAEKVVVQKQKTNQ